MGAISTRSTAIGLARPSARAILKVSRAGEAAWLRRPGAGKRGRVHRVQVEADVQPVHPVSGQSMAWAMDLLHAELLDLVHADAADAFFRRRPTSSRGWPPCTPNTITFAGSTFGISAARMLRQPLE